MTGRFAINPIPSRMTTHDRSALATTAQTPGNKLRELLARGGGGGGGVGGQCLMMPGAFNALCALAIARAGFEGAYISGAATSVSAGVPDVGILSLEHFCRVIRECHDASGLPMIADADTGFGESEMVRRTVVEYARAGAAGLHLEDQVFPKRCGHLDGKKLIPFDHACEKVAAAAKTARELKGAEGFVICAARMRGVEGFDAAVERASQYVQAGAEMIFPEGLTTEKEFADFAAALRRALGANRWCWLLANMTEFGKTPMISAKRFGEMGYNCVIYPVTLLRSRWRGGSVALGVLKEAGSAETLLSSMQTREELYRLIGYKPGVEWEFPAR